MCAGTRPHTQVVVYSTPGLEYWYSDVLTSFQSSCAVTISYASAPSPALLDRLRDERPAPLADVVIAQPPELTTAANDSLLDDGGLVEAAAVPAERCDDRHRWCTVAENYSSWVYDPLTVARPPLTWADLLDSRFAGHIVSSGPIVPAGLANVVLLARQMGTAGAFEYLAHLEAATSGHYLLTDSMSRAVAAGSGPLVANGDLQEDLNDIDQYHSVAIWFPTLDATSRSALALPYGAARVRGGHNPDNARALLRLLWSVAGQSGVGAAYLAPARPDVVPTDTRSKRLRAALAGVTVVRPNWEQVARDQTSLIARWQALRTAPDGPTASPPTTTPQLFP